MEEMNTTYCFQLSEPFNEVHLTLSDEATYNSLYNRALDDAHSGNASHFYTVGFSGLDGMDEGEKAVVFMTGNYNVDTLPQWSEREPDGSYRVPDWSKGETPNYTPLGRQVADTISTMIKALKAA